MTKRDVSDRPARHSACRASIDPYGPTIRRSDLDESRLRFRAPSSGGLASSDLSALRHGGTEVRRVPDLGGKARRRRRLECDVHAENTVVGRPHRTDADSSSGLTLFDIRRLPRPSSTGTQGFSSGTVRPSLSAFSAPAPRREAANGAAARTQAMHF